MGGKEGPRSAVHVEGGPAASRAGGTCGHSAVGNGQLAGEWTAGWGLQHSGQGGPSAGWCLAGPWGGERPSASTRGRAGGLPETGCRRVSVHTHPGRGPAWPGRPCVLGRVSQGLFAGSHAPSGSFSRLTPRNPVFVGWGARTGCAGSRRPRQRPWSRSRGRRCGCSPQACLPGGCEGAPEAGWGQAGLPASMGKRVPFFALQGPAQAECEAPGPTVWRTPQNLFSLGPPIPTPKRRVPGGPGTRSVCPLWQRWGELGPAQHPPEVSAAFGGVVLSE